MDGPEPLEELRALCRETHHATIQAAKACVAKEKHDTDVVHKTWEKFQQDMSRGYIGELRDLSTLDLSQVLLVDSFGVWEKHAASQWEVRGINNLKANKFNIFAWVPSKVEYDHFEEMVEATRV